MPGSAIRIASRTSDLALWQAHYIADRLRQLDSSPEVEIVRITTSGDRDQTSALSQFGGMGAFTKEVQHAVLDGRADVAVHSLKDLPTEPTDQLVLATVPERASTADVLLFPRGSDIPATSRDLPDGLRIGTGSPRRRALLRRLNPAVDVVPIRGNVPTRLGKLDEGEFQAIVLAAAGLDRLGLADREVLRLEPPDFYPAVGQGALGIECHVEDNETTEILAQLTCEKTYREVVAERAMLATLRAGCHAPVGVECRCDSDRLELTGVLLDDTGQTCLKETASGGLQDPVNVGQSVAEALLSAGGEAMLANS